MSATEKQSARIDRDEVFLELTKSICPVCKRVIDAEVNIREGKVFMRKRCREHGVVRGARLRRRRAVLSTAIRFNKPGHDAARVPDRGARRMPARLRALPRPQAARVPRPHRGQHRLQPRLPDLLRRLGSPARRLLAHARAASRACSTRSSRPRASPRSFSSRGASRRSIPTSSSSSRWPTSARSRHVMLNTNGIRLARDRRFAEEVARSERRPLPPVRRVRRGDPPDDPRHRTCA